jgi:Domain of unknown function (DUF397).
MDGVNWTWKKASRSTSNGGMCVEVAVDAPGIVPVRDSKCPEVGYLPFGRDDWAAFMADVKAGRFDL